LLGWLCILPITGIFGKTVYSASSSIWFIILGGLFYSTGLLFYARDSIKWNHTRWHIFVMLGYLMHVIAHYQVINY
jgi:hemolysin III